MFSPSEFINFLKNPKYPFLERKGDGAIKTAVKIYFLTLLFIGLINWLNITILQTFLVLPKDESLEIPELMRKNLIAYFVLVVIIAPTFEEIIFRLPIIFSPSNLALSISTLIFLIIHKFINGVLPLVFFLLAYLLIYWIAYVKKEGISRIWSRNFTMVFYFLSLSFGLAHITNYSYLFYYQYLIGLILIFPQLCMGFILSFTRVYYKNGFLICVFNHILMNMFSVTIFLLQNRQI